MTMITPSYLGETIEYSSLHACRSTLEDPTGRLISTNRIVGRTTASAIAAASIMSFLFDFTYGFTK